MVQLLSIGAEASEREQVGALVDPVEQVAGERILRAPGVEVTLEGSVEG